MKFGFIPTEGGRFYREALAEVEHGEALGFDSVWMEEHHGVRDHYWPSPLMVLAGFATRTSRLRLGTDVMSNGRFVEALSVIRALWTQERVTLPGPHYPLQDARIEPRPVQSPHPPIWIGGWGEITLRPRWTGSTPPIRTVSSSAAPGESSPRSGGSWRPSGRTT